MNKYIDRDVLLKAVRKLQPNSTEYDKADYWAARDMCEAVISVIEHSDVEDVQPSKVGYWRLCKLNETGNYDLECGNCGFRVVLDPYEMKYANFCNNCGMKNKRLVE
jgi:hypothetical protein